MEQMTNKDLNGCLERLSRGEELESCLKDYPKEAEELRLSLKTAVGITRYAETIKLRPEFIAQTQANLGKGYESKYLSWKAKIAGILKPVGRFAAVTAIAIVILGLVFTGGVALSVLASEDAMPEQALHPVKLATEQIRTTFAFSNERKVSYLTQFAETRAGEIAYAYEKGDIDQVEAGLQRLEGHLAEVENLFHQDGAPIVIAAPTSRSPELQRIESTVQNSSARAEAKLKNIKEPDPEKKSKIIDRVDKAYSKAIKAIKSAR